MRVAMKFTDIFVRNLKTEKRLEDVREGEGEGFGIRVFATGAKVFFYSYHFDSKRRFLRLGDYPTVSLGEARKRLTAARKKLDEGKDPLGERMQNAIDRRRTPFVADFIREYIERHAKLHNKGWREIERALNANILPQWGRRKISDIRRRDLVVILDEIADRGAPIMANRVLAYTRKMFSYAVKRDVIEINPFMGMDRPEREKSRERALSWEEIRTLWENMDASGMSDKVCRCLKLILVTGQRPGEVIGMHTREISGDWWTIPVERSKNKQAHRVFLTPLAKDLIGEAEGFVFPSPANPGTSLEVRTLTSAIKGCLPHTPESGVEDRLKIAHFVPHDLRRSAATCWAEMGFSGELIDRLQNHITRQKQGVGHVYNRYSYDREKQAALEAWERKLISITTGRDTSKVLSIVRRPQLVQD